MKAILLGFGNVGRGLARSLIELGERKGKRIPLEIVAIADSRSAAISESGLDLVEIITKKESTGLVGTKVIDPADLIRETEAEVVVELTPSSMNDGLSATSSIRTALQTSKNVVTANKMPLALHFHELMGEAKKRDLKIFYGACVGGGLPVLEVGRACSQFEPVESITGVLNATSNFILTKMHLHRESYSSALQVAQRLGFAEPDPGNDVSGMDAALKLIILANDIMEKNISLKDIKPLRGIERISSERIQKAKGKGKSIRLVAKIAKGASVSPVEVDERSPLNVEGANNAVIFRGRASGECVISGQAAGAASTTRALLRDLLTLESSFRGMGSQAV